MVDVAELRGFVTARKPARQIPAPHKLGRSLATGCSAVRVAPGRDGEPRGASRAPGSRPAVAWAAPRRRTRTPAAHCTAAARSVAGQPRSAASTRLAVASLDWISCRRSHTPPRSWPGRPLREGPARAVGLSAGAGQFGAGGQRRQRGGAPLVHACADRPLTRCGPSPRRAPRSAPHREHTGGPTCSWCPATSVGDPNCTVGLDADSRQRRSAPGSYSSTSASMAASVLSTDNAPHPADPVGQRRDPPRPSPPHR